MKTTTPEQKSQVANFLWDQAGQLGQISDALMDLAVDNRANAMEFYEAAHLAKRAAEIAEKQASRLQHEWFVDKQSD